MDTTFVCCCKGVGYKRCIRKILSQLEENPFSFRSKGPVDVEGFACLYKFIYIFSDWQN